MESLKDCSIQDLVGLADFLQKLLNQEQKIRKKMRVYYRGLANSHQKNIYQNHCSVLSEIIDRLNEEICELEHLNPDSPIKENIDSEEIFLEGEKKSGHDLTCDLRNSHLMVSAVLDNKRWNPSIPLNLKFLMENWIQKHRAMAQTLEN